MSRPKIPETDILSGNLQPQLERMDTWWVRRGPSEAGARARSQSTTAVASISTSKVGRASCTPTVERAGSLSPKNSA